MNTNIKEAAAWIGSKVLTTLAIGAVAITTGLLMKVSKEMITATNDDFVKITKQAITAVKEMKQA